MGKNQAAPPSSLEDWLKAKRIVIFVGAGGVGKTTSSIAAAIAGAKMGRRVALLSIDPARRLAAALGITLGNQLSKIEFAPHAGVTGSVHAAMLDQKAVFDRMVRKHAPSPKVAEKILADPLYKAASSNLAGPLEYMALAKLHELAEDPSFDLIVLDTPPDSHALDFLARPNLLSGFMDNKVLSWLIKPFLMAGRLGLGRVLSLGEKLMGGMASVTGVDALRNFGEFLVLMQEVIEGFHKSGERVVELLRDPQTGFGLVTLATCSAARSAKFLTEQLQLMDYHLDVMIVNRCLPGDVAAAATSKRGTSGEIPRDLLKVRVEGEKRILQLLRGMGLKASGRPPWAVLKVEEQTEDLHTLAAVCAFAEKLSAARG